MPEVSVIVPAFNAEAFLGEQLAALVAQETAIDHEIVVVDNRSRDRTVHVAREWSLANPRIRVLSAADRQGPSHARNRGLTAARGEIVLFCDVDDVVQPRWIEALARSVTTTTIAVGMLATFTDGDPADSGRLQWRLPVQHCGLSLLPGANIGARRSLLLDVGGFDERLTAGEDIDLSIRAHEAGASVVEVPEARYLRREPRSCGVLFRKGFGYGTSVADLDRRLLAAGCGPLYSSVAKRAGWLAVRTPYLVLGAHRRRVWCKTAGHVAGRVGTRLGRS